MFVCLRRESAGKNPGGGGKQIELNQLPEDESRNDDDDDGRTDETDGSVGLETVL